MVKIFILIFDSGLQKDQEDITTLCQQLQIWTRDEVQQLVEQYIPKRDQQINDLNDALDAFFLNTSCSL